MNHAQAPAATAYRPRRLRHVLLRAVVRVIGLVRFARHGFKEPNPTRQQLMDMDEERFIGAMGQIGLNVEPYPPAGASSGSDRA